MTGETRENGTNYSGSKASRREQMRFEGGKNRVHEGSVAGRAGEIDVGATSWKKPRDDEVKEKK